MRAILLYSAVVVILPTLVFAYPSTMKLTFVGCKSRETFARAMRMGQQNDTKAIAQMVIEKECRVIERGQALEVEDVTWSGLVQVRLRGNPQAWWTAIELVERPSGGTSKAPANKQAPSSNPK
jgi:hypothetical protein